MPKSPWVAQSFLAMLLLCPAWLAIAFFKRNLDIDGKVFLLWYFTGSIIGGLASQLSLGATFATLAPSAETVVAMLFVGIFFGAAANSLLFDAVSSAPNAGLPVALANAASVLVFLASLALAAFLPRYFDGGRFVMKDLLGIILTVAGVGLIAIR